MRPWFWPASFFGEEFLSLHRPVVEVNEHQYLVDRIDSNFVSSVVAKITKFEQAVAAFTGSKYALATVNGTFALHVAMTLANVLPDDKLISKALTFIATFSVIRQAGAYPVLIDVDLDTMGISPDALEVFLLAHAEMKNGQAFNRTRGKRFES